VSGPMKRLFLVAIILVLGLVLTLPARAEGVPGAGGGNLITMNFQDVDISVLAKFISEITGKNFVVDEGVRGRVTIISPTKVTPEQAYSIFKSVLQIKGFTTEDSGPIVRIIPSRDARSAAALTNSNQPAEMPNGDEYVTRMIRLVNADASALVSMVQPLISRDGLVAAFPETNTLIITDDAWNVQRLLKIIGVIDAEKIQESVEVVPLKLAYADDLAPKVEQIMGAESGGGSESGRAGYARPMPMQMYGSEGGGGLSSPSRPIKIIPDERTNSLIVMADPLQMRMVKSLISQLDIHSPTASSRVHVYYLKYAEALEMVSVLGSLLGSGSGPGALSPQTGKGSLGRSSGLGYGGFGTGGVGGGSLGNAAFGSSGGFGSGGGFGNGFGGGLGGSSNRAAGSLGGGGAAGGGAGGPMAVTAAGGPGTEFEEEVHVAADPATNSLVVSAAPQDYSTLEKIISQLDVPRRQVYVQAVIVEVSAQRMRELGISYQGATTLGGNTLGFGHFDYGNLANALTNPLGVTGLTFGLASGTMCTVNTTLSAASSVLSGTSSSSTTTAVTVPCDIALITALETDTRSNVLSAPTLLTADNEEATIVVGENLPFLSSATATAALSDQIFQSVDRQNVGITLDVVPQITEGGYIKLDVYEEVSAVIASTVNNPLGPTTTIRSASTTVLVQNHRTTVIGGLLSDEVDITKQGVPYLSDIPVLGNLFTNRQRNGQKTDLLVFLTPHVILNREDLRELSLDERQRFLQSLGRKEIHDMPLQQVREIFKPSFSTSVPPGAEFGSPNPQPGNVYGPPSTGQLDAH
jgi:general secretion pathway protein D